MCVRYGERGKKRVRESDVSVHVPTHMVVVLTAFVAEFDGHEALHDPPCRKPPGHVSAVLLQHA